VSGRCRFVRRSSAPNQVRQLGVRKPPNQALHLTGAAILVLQGSLSKQRPRQVSLGVIATRGRDVYC
jgi:hypothetical protein